MIKRDLIRVNINLPVELTYKVSKYAHMLGIPITHAYIVLLNESFKLIDKDFWGEDND